MATTLKNKPLSFNSLPVEILYRILDYVDGRSIFFSFRYVCKNCQAITNTYNRYKLNFSSISKTDLHLICRAIRPENVISLTLSDSYKTPGQSDLFFSLVDINQWTRLRCLTLLHINDNNLQTFLLHITTSCSLIALSIKFRVTESTETLAHILSIISQPTLRRLDFFDIYNVVIDKIQWPINSSLHYLQIIDCTFEQFCVILDHSPNLRTFVLRNVISNITGEPFLKSYPQLTSLSLNDAGIFRPLNEIKSILTLTPSLEYLKVIVLISDRSLFNGSEWENVIMTHLPHLQRFEFFFSEYNATNYNSVDHRSIMTRYQTPFWVETKRWSVVCTYDPTIHTIILYSTPMCLTSYTYVTRYRKKMTCDPITITNFETGLHILSKTPIMDTMEKEVCLKLINIFQILNIYKRLMNY
jgi:hypothetical protein